MMKDRFNDIDDVGIDWWQLGVVVMFILMAVGILTGCSHTKYVTVPEYHTEYIVRSDTFAKVDSVLLHDSVFVYHSGDTIVVNRVMYRDRVRNVYKVRVDTICKTDSVRVPYPIEKSGRQFAISGRQLLAWGIAFLLIGAGIVAWLAIRSRKKTT